MNILDTHQWTYEKVEPVLAVLDEVMSRFVCKTNEKVYNRSTMLGRSRMLYRSLAEPQRGWDALRRLENKINAKNAEAEKAMEMLNKIVVDIYEELIKRTEQNEQLN